MRCAASRATRSVRFRSTGRWTTRSHHAVSNERALSWFAPTVPNRVVLGNTGPRKRLLYVFENLPAKQGSRDGSTCKKNPGWSGPGVQGKLIGCGGGSNRRPSGYEPDELPLLHPATREGTGGGRMRQTAQRQQLARRGPNTTDRRPRGGRPSTVDGRVGGQRRRHIRLDPSVRVAGDRAARLHDPLKRPTTDEQARDEPRRRPRPWQ